PDQRLLDAQLRTCRRLFWHAPAGYRLMVACGDVLLRSDAAPPVFPEADILVAGIHATPEEASHHGVMFCHADNGGRMQCFLQKPSPARIRELSADHACLLDTGVWLFSARALALLLQRCGWDERHPDAPLQPYELFDRFGPSLGVAPSGNDPEVNALTAAVLPLPAGRFYHFGTNRSMLGSVAQLSAPDETRHSYGHTPGDWQRPLSPLNSRVETHGAAQPDIWIESSRIPAAWRLTRRHMLTGIPDNGWNLDLPPGACLDCVPVQGETKRLCLRAYGFDDAFKGRLDDPATIWQGKPFNQWLADRGLTFEAARLDPAGDIQHAALMPLAAPDDSATGPLLRWMLSPERTDDRVAAQAWLDAPRLSAADLLQRADVRRRQAIRQELLRASFGALSSDEWAALATRIDLEALAQAIQADALPPPPDLPAEQVNLAAVHHAMLTARIGGGRDTAAEQLRNLMVGRLALAAVQPQRSVLEDQIVWGRSPVRLDLAGGWTDTPPYCLEHGGRVVNLAVDLNGQPPIQAFARVCQEPHIVLHSIDLGLSERVSTYDELRQPARLGDGFAIARAALRLAGFDPRFHEGTAPSTLARLLERNFGGGIELNMLAAIPKGSGLGTSSILAATLLGTLGDLCGLHWTNDDIFLRTLVLEQILGSGGGWQDQAGGVIGGLKLIESAPGLTQRPVVRWLPPQGIAEAIREQRILLYYTGLTRVAHNILGEIVRGIFLNDAARIATVDAIGYAADFAADAIQRQSWDGLCEAVRRSWQLNQALDSGTNPPPVQDILARVANWVAAAKLLGAGGGGYLLILARDQQAGAHIRHALSENPPNARGRFVNLSISETGLQVTRS
ncbi:MAG: bifunctional fucokinase/fucose-1-phosphate guanylyltransferase, partial [Kiritimatiellae bacterium]|nr:bifunctional fucokinase/fucose-1-phosphate guanylyltransferase [Kiritimatiellia bacterium]